eukprot:1576335-Ditylum_brightwellii.AAC.1
MNLYRPTTDDYQNTVFETADLTKIYGEPTMATLLTLQNKLKANVQSVQSTLGGGNNDHLGLVLTTAAYEHIPGTTPYTRPTQPVPNLPAAVDKKYFKAIRNSSSNNIMLSIPAILDHLLDNYRDVTAEELRGLCAQVKNLSHDICKPVDNIFTEIEDLEEIVKLSKDPITEQQMISIAYLIQQKNAKYRMDLKEWNRKAHPLKTWADFKSEFCTTQKELCKTGELTVEDSVNHNELANMVTEGTQQAF